MPRKKNRSAVEFGPEKRSLRYLVNERLNQEAHDRVSNLTIVGPVVSCYTEKAFIPTIIAMKTISRLSTLWEFPFLVTVYCP